MTLDLNEFFFIKNKNISHVLLINYCLVLFISWYVVYLSEKITLQNMVGI